MTVNEVVLRAGHQVNLGIGSFGVINVAGLPDGSAEVYLSIKTDDEYEVVLRSADTFPVRDQTWKLDRVESPGGPDWAVVLTRAE